jgi:hypothetical protein
MGPFETAADTETLRRLAQADEGIEKNRSAIALLSTDGAVMSAKIDSGFDEVRAGINQIQTNQAKQTAANWRSFWAAIMALIGLAGAAWGFTPTSPANALEAPTAPAELPAIP